MSMSISAHACQPDWGPYHMGRVGRACKPQRLYRTRRQGESFNRQPAHTYLQYHIIIHSKWPLKTFYICPKCPLGVLYLCVGQFWAKGPFWSGQNQFFRRDALAMLASQIQYAKLQFHLCSVLEFFSLTLFSQTSLVVFQGPDNLILNYASLFLVFIMYFS